MSGSKEFNSPHILLLTDRQVSYLRKAFVNKLLGVVKFSKTQFW